MSLDHFIAVRDGARAPFFHQSRTLELGAAAAGWSDHAAGVALRRASGSQSLPGDSTLDTRPPRQTCSLLDLKIALADRALDSCTLCPHRCKVNRNRGETGFCGVAAESAVHWEGILHGEELPLVPSHEVFLSGCTMRCAFCYSHEHIVRPMSGRTISPDELAACAGVRRCPARCAASPRCPPPCRGGIPPDPASARRAATSESRWRSRAAPGQRPPPPARGSRRAAPSPRRRCRAC